MSSVHDFAEGAVWHPNGDSRGYRNRVVFTIRAPEGVRGHDLSGDFEADYGIFFDPDDEYIMEILTGEFPQVDWSTIRFYRSMDSSAVYFGEFDSFDDLGEIVLRRFDRLRGTPVSGENVVDMMIWKEKRDEQEVRGGCDASSDRDGGEG